MAMIGDSGSGKSSVMAKAIQEAEKPILLFLDALDQLSDSNNAKSFVFCHRRQYRRTADE